MSERRTSDLAVAVPPPAALIAHWELWTGADRDDLAALGGSGLGGSGLDGSRLGAVGTRLVVVESATRSAPGWDGGVQAVTGVVDPVGNAVVSLPIGHARWARTLLAGGGSLDDLTTALPERLAMPEAIVYHGIYRWAVAVPPADELPDAGEWLPVADPAVPAWLHPFGGEALVVRDAGLVVAGVGIKRHDRFGQEIAVVTDEAARGRGLARRLVAQAARSLIADGVVPTYLHAAGNAASAQVADAAGFPFQGWGVLGIGMPPGDES